MRRIKTTTGTEIALDGDLLAVMETLYREILIKVTQFFRDAEMYLALKTKVLGL